MGKSTGPVLAAGVITWANHTFFEEGSEFVFEETVRTAVGTGLAAGFLTIIEKGAPQIAVMLSYAALLTVLLVPIRGSDNSPAVNALQFLGVIT